MPCLRVHCQCVGVIGVDEYCVLVIILHHPHPEVGGVGDLSPDVGDEGEPEVGVEDHAEGGKALLEIGAEGLGDHGLGPAVERGEDESEAEKEGKKFHGVINDECGRGWGIKRGGVLRISKFKG